MSDLASYCIIYKHVDALNYSGVYISKDILKTSCEAYKDLAFMIETNDFFRYYIVIMFDMVFGINIRLYDNRMYISHSITNEVLNDIRQWKLERK